MYSQFYSLQKEEIEKLASYLGSSFYLSNTNDELQSSSFWQNLQKRTCVSLNPGGVHLTSGFNFKAPPQRVWRFHSIVEHFFKFSFFRKVLSGFNKITNSLLETENRFQKKMALKEMQILYRSPYAGKFVDFSPSLQKALTYNAIGVCGAVENISYIKRAIADSFQKKDRFVFLEIGAGAGMTILDLLDSFPQSKAIIIDLPEVIPIGYTLMSYFASRKMRMRLPHEWKDDYFADDDADIYFLTPDQIANIPNNAIDFFINSSSMQEMEFDTIRNYFSEMVRLGKEASLFYCRNLEYSRQHYVSFKGYPWNLLGRTLYEGIAPYSTKHSMQAGGKSLIKIVAIK